MRTYYQAMLWAAIRELDKPKTMLPASCGAAYVQDFADHQGNFTVMVVGDAGELTIKGKGVDVRLTGSSLPKLPESGSCKWQKKFGM